MFLSNFVVQLVVFNSEREENRILHRACEIPNMMQSAFQGHSKVTG